MINAKKIPKIEKQNNQENCEKFDTFLIYAKMKMKNWKNSRKNLNYKKSWKVPKILQDFFKN